MKNYLTSILAKLGLGSRTQAAVLVERLRADNQRMAERAQKLEPPTGVTVAPIAAATQARPAVERAALAAIAAAVAGSTGRATPGRARGRRSERTRGTPRRGGTGREGVSMMGSTKPPTSWAEKVQIGKSPSCRSVFHLLQTMGPGRHRGLRHVRGIAPCEIRP